MSVHKTQSDFSIGELAEILGITHQTLLIRCREKQLPGAYRVGRLWRVRREMLPAIRGEAQSPRKN